MYDKLRHIASIRSKIYEIQTRLNRWRHGADESAFLAEAAQQACEAALSGNYGIGAVLVHEGKIVARGHNRVTDTSDPMHHVLHAEVDAMRNYHNFLLPGERNQAGITMYTTLEPCPMCTCAMFNAGIRTAIVGSLDEWTGQLISNPSKMPSLWLTLLRRSQTKHQLAQNVPEDLRKICREVFLLTKNPLDRLLSEK